MLRAVLIDDERPALRMLEKLLQDYPMVEISGMYTNPLEAIDKIAAIRPQIVFLDINMPQLQGIDAASKILDQCPDADIIFVTAFDQYAVEAFELYALDYLLKPVAKERFKKTMQRVIKKNGAIQLNSKGNLAIKCLGRFQVRWHGEAPVKWRSEKTRELFAFLLFHRDREVSKDEILDQLWPEVDYLRAVHQLHNGIYYIRKTLEQYGIDKSLIRIFGSYRLKLGAVDLDVMLFRERLEKIKRGPAIADLEAAEALYVGEYLEGTDWHWAALEREQLSRQYEEVVIALSRAYMQQKAFNSAGELLERAFNRNPYDERIAELLMEVYSMTGDKVRATRLLSEYTRILKEDLGIKPQESINRIYASIN
ncbi:MAG: response regulator [Desulfotomaculaceae bacterium]|nr:response regulator [Desulfotomaculaceae bacterium]